MKSTGLLFIIGLVVIILQLSRYGDTFMPVNIINLDISQDRLRNISLDCYIYGIPFNRHPAVDGRIYTFTENEKNMLFGLALRRQNKIKIHEFRHTPEERIILYNKWEKEETYKKTKRVMSCALSHIQVWQRYMNTVDPYVMILEDDGKINSHIRQHVNTCVRKLDNFDPDWHIVWLSGKEPGDREQIIHWNAYNVYRMNPPEYIGQGGGAYILSRKGIRHFLKVLEGGCWHPADIFLFKTLDKQHAYGVHPPLVDIHHNTTVSTIV